MTTHTKSIHRWDVISADNLTKFPMVYIKPDMEFLSFARNNEFSAIVTINGTNTIYDKRPVVGYINQSGNVPNCRPNFYKETGDYVVTLAANWYGYPLPEKLGTITFYGSSPERKVIPTQENSSLTSPSAPSLTSIVNNTSSDDNISKWIPQVILILGFIVFLIFLLWRILVRE